jgi:hypothetical protein
MVSHVARVYLSLETLAVRKIKVKIIAVELFKGYSKVRESSFDFLNPF